MKITEPAVANYYKKMQIVTASRHKQITMMHEKCVNLILRAKKDTGTERRKFLDGAQNILAQFQSALRIEDDVSEGLFYLYDYSYMLLQKGGAEDVKKALEVLQILADTFRQLLMRF